MIRKTVKAGKRKYKPGHGLCLRRNRFGYRLRYAFPKGAWYPPRLDENGDNIEQWNKLGGVGFFNLLPWTWRPNDRTALVAFRPSKLEYHFELAAYVNTSTTSWTVKPLLTVPADRSPGNVRVVGSGSDWYWDHSHQGKERGAEITVPYRNFQHNIGPWFGGSRRAGHKHSVITEME